jgi:WD40 repeat protein
VWTARQNDVRHCAVSPDGRWALTGSHVTGGVWVCDARSGERVKQVQREGGWGAFSPDGRCLAVGSFSGAGKLWRAPTWEPIRELDGPHFAFSGDGQLLAVGGGELSQLRLIACEDGREVARLELPDLSRLRPCGLSPDGATLLVAAVERRVLYAIDLRSVRRELAELGLDWDWPALPPAASPCGPVTVTVLE